MAPFFVKYQNVRDLKALRNATFYLPEY